MRGKINRLTTYSLFFCGLLVATGTSVQAASQFGEEYQITPEDVLEISVWKEPDLQRTVIVRPDGGITMPLIGNVYAAGLTTTELQVLMTEKLDEYVPNPVLTVSLKEIRGFKLYVMGEVVRPGEFLVGRYVDVLQALTMAGGMTPFADKSEIRILRREGSEESVFYFNYNQVQKGRKLEQNILLKPGDTIIVP